MSRLALVRLEPFQVVRTFPSNPPITVSLPDMAVQVSPGEAGWSGYGFAIVPVVEVDFAKPGEFFDQGADAESFDGTTLTVTRGWLAWDQARIDAWRAAKRDSIVNNLNAQDDVIRALAMIVMDELNLHSARLASVLAAAANAGTYAAFRTAMGSVAAIQQRTPAQIRAAIRAKLDVDQ